MATQRQTAPGEARTDDYAEKRKEVNRLLNTGDRKRFRFTKDVRGEQYQFTVPNIPAETTAQGLMSAMEGEGAQVGVKMNLGEDVASDGFSAQGNGRSTLGPAAAAAVFQAIRALK